MHPVARSFLLVLVMGIGCGQQPPPRAVIVRPPAPAPAPAKPPAPPPPASTFPAATQVASAPPWGAEVSPPSPPNVPPEPPARVRPGLPEETRTIAELPQAGDLPRVTLSTGYFLEAGGIVYDVRTGMETGKAHDVGKTFPQLPKALSRDGRYFAAFHRSADGRSSEVVVSETASGAILHTWPTAVSSHEAAFSFLAFTERNQVCALGPVQFDKSCLYVWDARSGDTLREIPGGRVLTDERPALSADGSLLVVTGNDGPLLFDVPRQTVRAKLTGGESRMQTRFAAFSPQGDRFFMETPSHRLLWNLQGALTARASATNTPTLAWLPDGSGFHGGSSAFHGRYGELWRGAHRPGNYLGVLGGEYVVGLHVAHKTNRLFAFRWPWLRVQESLTALERGAGLVQPGQEVELALEVGEVRFANSDEVRGDLSAAVEKKLTESGFRVVPSASLKMSARYAEGPGGPLLLGGRDPVYKSHMAILQEITDPLNAHRAATLRDYEQRGLVRQDGAFLEIKIGQHVLSERRDSTAGPETTRCSLHLSLQSAASDEILWRGKYGGSGGLRTGDAVTRESLRAGAFDGVKINLSFAALPYFIPSDKNVAALPIVEDQKP